MVYDTAVNERALFWTLVAIMFALSLVALVLSALAYTDSQQDSPHHNIVRRDVLVRGDLVVDGEARVEGSTWMDDSLTVKGSTTLGVASQQTLKVSPLAIISETGTIFLPKDSSAIRIDTPTGSVNFPLPLASESEGVHYFVSKSLIGQASSATLQLQGSNTLCTSSSCTVSDPAFSMNTPRPQSVHLYNDGVNVWFANV